MLFQLCLVFIFLNFFNNKIVPILLKVFSFLVTVLVLRAEAALPKAPEHCSETCNFSETE